MKGVCIMAKSKRQNYTIDTTKKIITATISELDAVEKEIVQMYINAGYVLHKGKSNPWNKSSIVKWLKYYISEEAAEEFENACGNKKIGWVQARTEFFAKYTAENRAEIEKQSAAKKVAKADELKKSLEK